MYDLFRNICNRYSHIPNIIAKAGDLTKKWIRSRCAFELEQDISDNLVNEGIYLLYLLWQILLSIASESMDSQSLQQTLDSIAFIYYSYQRITPAKTIIFTEDFEGIISDIPEGVERIEIRNAQYQSLLCLPESLKSLYINCDLKEVQLPDFLEFLELGIYFKGKVRGKSAQWPKYLKSLSMYNADVDSLPESLEYLKLNDNILLNRINYKLPKSIKKLIVSQFCTNIGLKDLPNLEYLKIPSIEERNIAALSQLSKLRILICEDCPGMEIEFPSSLEHLEIRNSSGAISNLPSNLRILIVPKFALKGKITLPKTLRIFIRS